MDLPGESEQIIRKRGRPKGHRLSHETKLKISTSRLKQEAAKREVRKAALGICVACHETGPQLAPYTYRDGSSHVLCASCRKVAEL